jgi:hypothetical protein
VKRFVLAMAGGSAAAVVLALCTSMSAGAASIPRHAPVARQASVHQHVVQIAVSAGAHPGAEPLYEDPLSSNITCANWSGDLSWGHEGTTAYITISNGVLEDNCSSGYARLYLHYDTIDNPKNPEVRQTGPDSGSGTPYSVTDSANSYKDIYVYICSQGDGAYRCGNKKGPGA